MLDGSMKMSCHGINCPPVFLSCNVNKTRTNYRKRLNLPIAIQVSAILEQNEESRSSSECKKISSSVTSFTRCQMPSCLHSRANTVGIIGGVSVLSTLIFLEKFVWWSSRSGEECVPFIVSSDPSIRKEILPLHSPILMNHKHTNIQFNHGMIVDNLRCKRAFLEQSGVGCIVMPCHIAHEWYSEVSMGCSVPFLNASDCVATELKEAELKPLETCTSVRIGVLATYTTLMAGFYQEKLQNQGFEVVLPDKQTMEHIVIPAMEARNRRDMEGARNLLRIAIQILLVRAANVIILASDEFQGLLPHDDLLLKKCIDPMDALARSTIKWAQAATASRVDK